ncbi:MULTISPECIES: hemolysin family protein [Capnocytophaga]|nr:MULTISPECIES: hemolysin family protein [Capnocytophaga]QLF50707.1 HlyC/CorC family transporter [Capnocytophaga sp. oral taxon 902]UAK52295.1 hemolysin family protein [Capnocytophaga ochracea]UZD41858.1 hemolysin family protein [Capnocytophaga ochracea]
MEPISVIIILTTLVLSAFFSGFEIAYVSSNKVHVEILKKQEGVIANVLTKLTRKPSKLLATMLVGNNVALVVYGFEMGKVMTVLLPPFFQNVLWHTIISTLIILITAEFMPKVFFQIYANQLLKVFAIPAYFFYLLFYPFSSFVMWISDFVLRVFFKTKGDYVPLSFSKVELVDYISEQMENAPKKEEVDSEVQMFQNALEFSGVKAREIMIPRTEIVAVELNESIENLIATFVSSGFSKILIYNENIDDILGYVHSFDMFKKPKAIKEVLIPIVNIPETIQINEVLNILTRKRKSMAVVLDEYGGTSGIVTLEDIVEELFGEIEDEHDKDKFIEEQISDTEYLFSARLEVEYLNETYHLDIPESEEYETLGGFIVLHNEGIPTQGEVIEIPPFTFTIEACSQTKIETVRLTVNNE